MATEYGYAIGKWLPPSGGEREKEGGLRREETCRWFQSPPTFQSCPSKVLMHGACCMPCFNEMTYCTLAATVLLVPHEVVLLVPGLTFLFPFLQSSIRSIPPLMEIESCLSSCMSHYSFIARKWIFGLSRSQNMYVHAVCPPWSDIRLECMTDWRISP